MNVPVQRATDLTHDDLRRLAADVKRIGAELGFRKVGIAGVNLEADERRLSEWLAAGRHGAMTYMERHGTKRSRPAALVPGTARVISARMDYWPAGGRDAKAVLADKRLGYVARYALGRDYHKVLRARLAKLADAVAERAGPHGHRVFVDSAPVLEKALARNAGLGWIGKHTNLLDRDAGSWFLLGEVFTDLPLPVDAPVTEHCGSCRACLDVCPTGAIVAPYRLDARRCISYLTIELRGSIPEELREAVGNRIFGCDDCQLFCPWNKFARATAIDDFAVRHALDGAALADLFAWSEDEWDARTAGSALRRAGYEGWLRNIAVALGNAPSDARVLAALAARSDHPSPVVREHVRWALARHASRAATATAATSGAA
ncbi:MAG TPA: tRNA epoxyqueuosine(34) reductase QueG [Gammaproteobacteria bacterium]|nr:tRNA epoxyqueuosine(34) reductase QueG [Gammaproteobacteria bacterium]